jgi:hypothetical protein
METDPENNSKPRRKRRHGAKNLPNVPRPNHRRNPASSHSISSFIPEEMREIVTDVGTFVFDDALSPSISYFLFRPNHDEISEVFEQSLLAGEPIDYVALDDLHYIAELRLSDGWKTLMADLFIDRDLVEDSEVQDIVESTLVLLDDIEPGPEGTTLTVFWMQEIGVYLPENFEYSSLVESLLEKGKPEGNEWEDYLALGFMEEHIPELVQMALDNNLHWCDDPQAMYGPVHAWRALGQLQATDAVKPLLSLFDMAEELDDDYIDDELHIVFGMIGAPAIIPLAEYALDDDVLHTPWARISAVIALSEVGERHPDLRERVVGELRNLLSNQIKCSSLDLEEQMDAVLNGFLISSLVDLGAVEAMPEIQQAFVEGIVDEMACGTREEVEREIKRKNVDT